jgi:hypothetical protein
MTTAGCDAVRRRPDASGAEGPAHAAPRPAHPAPARFVRLSALARLSGWMYRVRPDLFH